jgi:hypothetical protein
MRRARIELLLFAFAWLTYAYFHQGGGWNQNGRFALTRALVESREPWIDRYFVYASGGEGSTRLRRIPVVDGVFVDGGRSHALSWQKPDGSMTPLAADAPADAYRLPADWAGVTGDLAFAYGHLHPNKAPGASMAAVPGYALVFAVEKMFGADPDDARVLTVNAWLAGVLSVGLAAALGVVVFWRLALSFAGGRVGAALAATVALAFGTLYFPYATMMLEHVLVAAALIGAFYFAFEDPSPKRLFAAGACAGAAVVASYLSVVAVAALAAYVLWRRPRAAGAAAFAVGAAAPIAVLAAYNVACFGTIVAANYTWENPLFNQAGGGLAELFAAPRWDVLLALLVSPMRGLFVGAPVLVLGAAGLVAMLRRPRLHVEGLLCLAMIAHVLAFNISFTAWNGGWACGPRYLIPAIPFLVLPMVVVSPPAWLGRTLLAISIAGMSLATIVDPQPPPTNTAVWTSSPIWTVDLPQLVHGKPGAFANAHWPPALLSMYAEPVSANPKGFYSGAPGRLFPLGSEQTKRNSFNAGEVLFSGSSASVLPWLALAALFGFLMRREIQRAL